MTLLPLAVARDVAVTADEIAATISSSTAERGRADRLIARLIRLALAGTDEERRAERPGLLDQDDARLAQAVLRVAAAWPAERRAQADAWVQAIGALRRPGAGSLAAG